MAVDSDVSRAVMEQELADARDLELQHSWNIQVHDQLPRFTAEMTSYNGDRFYLEVDCADYRELPPYLEFYDPQTAERGTKRLYPFKSGESFFHEAPCICAPFNRKAYRAFFADGPHTDWSLAGGDWAKSNANNYQWSNISNLGDMLHIIQTRLLRAAHYERRMG